jgi:energy-coupling factor transport system ATP-binding protein
MTAIVRLRDVEFAYASARAVPEPALRGVTLEVQRGDRVGLMGASGSGKSTLLHLLAGLVRPQGGVVERAPDASSLASLVFQFPERQLFAETVEADVAYGLRQSGVPAAEVSLRAARALDDVGLPIDAFGPRPPFHLSGGEMRRVGLAGAIAQERSLLLLDEPTLGLDEEGLARLQAVLARVQARGVACWMASHDADFIAASCDRLVVLDAGRVAFEGEPLQLWQDAALAARLGAEVPRPVALAARLREAGVAIPAGCDREADLIEALSSLLTAPQDR